MKLYLRYAFLLPILYYDLLVSNFAVATIEVTIPQGKLVGSKLTARNGKQFYGFQSVPYAKPPVGELRFEPPQEPENWTSVRNAIEKPPKCIQKSYFSRFTPVLSGQEDCLYLNVYTQKFDGKAPVLVYFHGGGFTTGASYAHRANYLMDQGGIVLVTVNYRLGLLGFLSSGDEVVPGNNGMKDQVMALKWVKKNIAAFGGDRENVLIFGHSAGGVSVHLHMFSPLSKGLFHKAISLSGTASSPWATTPPSVMNEYFKTVSTLNGCFYIQTSDAVKCLKQIPANDLIEMQSKLFVWQKDTAGPKGPAVESNKAFAPFLTKKPQAGNELDPTIPWITGLSSAEGIFKADDYLDSNGTLLKYLNDNYRRLLPVITLHKPCFDKLAAATAFADDMKTIYFHNSQIGLETLKPLVDLLSDTYFSFGTTESVLNYKGRKYLYYFGHKSRSGNKQPYNERLTRLGVYHGEDLGYLFDEYANLRPNETMTNVDDLKLSENWIKILINFARTGDPNTNSIKDFRWDPVGENLSPYLNVSDDGLQLGRQNYFERKNHIWKDLSKYFN